MPRPRLLAPGLAAVIFISLAALNIATNPRGGQQARLALFIGIGVLILIGIGFLIWVIKKPRI